MKPLLVLVSLLAGLALAEGGLRLWLASRGEPYDGELLVRDLERTADTVAAFTPTDFSRPDSIPPDRVLHPYLGSESGPDPGGVLRYFATGPPEDDFEVLVVGGSVAMLFCNDAARELEARLAEDPRLEGRRVRVLNGAHAAYKQPQQVNKVECFFAQGIRPDVVVNLDGFNEIVTGRHNGMTGTNPLYPSAPVWAGLLWGRTKADAELEAGSVRLAALGERYAELLEQYRDLGLFRLASTGTWARRRLNAVQSRRVALQTELEQRNTLDEVGKRRRADRELVGDAYDRDPEAVLELAARIWVECSVSLDAICRARGVRYLHALQPTLWDPGAKPLTRKERDIEGPPEWRKGVLVGYPRLRQAIPEIEARGIAFLDLSMAFAEVRETLYFDACHFEQAGAQRLVDPIAEGVLALLP